MKTGDMGDDGGFSTSSVIVYLIYLFPVLRARLWLKKWCRNRLKVATVYPRILCRSGERRGRVTEIFSFRNPSTRSI